MICQPMLLTVPAMLGSYVLTVGIGLVMLPTLDVKALPMGTHWVNHSKTKLTVCFWISLQMYPTTGIAGSDWSWGQPLVNAANAIAD